MLVFFFLYPNPTSKLIIYFPFKRNKGTVTDVIGDTSTLSVSLDDGSMKTFELGKHNVRFVAQKQKRSRS